MPEDARDAFYVGYLPRSPGPLAVWVRSRILLLLGVALVLPVVLTIGQRPFASSVWEYGETRSFEGVLRSAPYPTLVVERPGGGASQYLLVGFGKRGVPPPVVAMDGELVRVEGTLVYRDDQTLIEIETVVMVPSSESHPELDVHDLGTHTFVGEIVDIKCFLGVMKPASLKPHRACATRCISGGIPPVLLVREADGSASYLLLTDRDGGAVNARVLDLVAQPIEVTGRLARMGQQLVLRADPATYRRIP